MSFQEWDNDSDYAHDEVGECVRCGQEFDMWKPYGIEHTRCPACRRKEREAKDSAMLYRIMPAHGWGYQLERNHGDGWRFIAQGSGGQIRHLLSCMEDIAEWP